MARNALGRGLGALIRDPEARSSGYSSQLHPQAAAARSRQRQIRRRRPAANRHRPDRSQPVSAAHAICGSGTRGIGAIHPRPAESSSRWSCERSAHDTS